MGAMNTGTTLEIFSQGPQTTLDLASKIAKNLRGGEIFELISDLGGGKTTLVKGIVHELGSDDATSPSFNIHNVYKSMKFDVHHYDFYRLNDAGVVGEELSEIIFLPNAVTFIEWGNVVHDLLPETRVVVTIAQQEGDNRQFRFEYPLKLDYIFTGVEV
jgi:tRNA threonylcarbamoyladenosine biosynthesis protein TsaE